MKEVKKLIITALACMIMLPFASITAYASQGTISLSDPTAKVGETVSISVKLTATGSETIKSVDMSLSYDESALEFDNGQKATADAGIVHLVGDADSAIKTYTLNFKALKGSTSNIKITDYEIKDNKDNVMEMSKVGSSTITISGDETTTAPNDTQDVTSSNTESQTPESKIVAPPKKDVQVKIAGTDFYVCKIPQDAIPKGFEYIGYLYQGVAVDALKKDGLIIFYLNQVGEQPYVFYVYDEQIEGFSIYAPVGTSLNYTVVNLGEEVTIPEGFTETNVSVGGVSVKAWQSNANSEYYLLYLMNSEGSKGLYLYDIMEKSVQRFYSIGTDSAENATDSYQTMYKELSQNYNKDIQSRMYIIYGLMVVTVVLVFVILNLIFRLMDKKHAHLYEEEEEDEEEQDNYDVSFLEDEDEETLDEILEDQENKEVSKETKKEMKKALKLEKKEKAKQKKLDKAAKKSDEMYEEEFENSEDDFDDSDDFEVQIFDLNEK